MVENGGGDDIKSLTRFQASPFTVNHDLLDLSDALEAADGVGAPFSSEPNILEATILDLTPEGLNSSPGYSGNWAFSFQ